MRGIRVGGAIRFRPHFAQPNPRPDHIRTLRNRNALVHSPVRHAGCGFMPTTMARFPREGAIWVWAIRCDEFNLGRQTFSADWRTAVKAIRVHRPQTSGSNFHIAARRANRRQRRLSTPSCPQRPSRGRGYAILTRQFTASRGYALSVPPSSAVTETAVTPAPRPASR